MSTTLLIAAKKFIERIENVMKKRKEKKNIRPGDCCRCGCGCDCNS